MIAATTAAITIRARTRMRSTLPVSWCGAAAGLAAAGGQQTAEEKPGAEGGKRRGDRSFLDLPAHAAGLALDFAPDLFGRGVRLSVSGDAVESPGNAVRSNLAHRIGELGEIGTELSDLSLQRGDLGIRFVSHGGSRLLHRSSNLSHSVPPAGSLKPPTALG